MPHIIDKEYVTSGGVAIKQFCLSRISNQFGIVFVLR